MKKNDEQLLNLVFFDNRFQELGLKRWWLAQEIGVDRKTVTRWLSGQTKKIKNENLEKLALILECEVNDLILKDKTNQFATSQEQKIAAKLIEQENLLEIITPTGKWSLLEGLIKASMEPNLPLSLLGELYNYLCIAAWRQSDLEKAQSYLEKALTAANESGHKRVLLRAKLNQGTIESFKGNIQGSLECYQFCIDNEKYIEDPGTIAAALSNIACVYHEYGDFNKSIMYQEKAIAAFTDLEKSLNLSISWVGMCDVLLEMGEYEKAWSACEKSLVHAEKSNLKRGLADGELFFALILCEQGQFHEAQKHLLKAINIFEDLGIKEGRTNRVRAYVEFGLGNNIQGLNAIEDGLKLSKDFPVEQARLLLTRFKFMKDENDEKAAINIFKESGAIKRLKT